MTYALAGRCAVSGELGTCAATADLKEGAAAFREKRKPKFQGR